MKEPTEGVEQDTPTLLTLACSQPGLPLPISAGNTGKKEFH
jgi:hypothetical protein